jgi:hypothetical protein
MNVRIGAEQGRSHHTPLLDASRRRSWLLTRSWIVDPDPSLSHKLTRVPRGRPGLENLRQQVLHPSVAILLLSSVPQSPTECTK